MKIFIDTANLAEIKEAAAMGLVDGVTTNPSLVARESGMDFRTLLGEICKIVDGDISAEVVATDAEGMLKEGRELAKIDPNIVVKIPLTKEGLSGLLLGSALLVLPVVPLSSVNSLPPPKT
mgnify:CR=1 FL=1